MSIDHEVEAILSEIGAQTPDEHWIHALNNGTHVLIRPSHAEDRVREFEFINTLSFTSRRNHFVAMMSLDLTDNHAMQHLAKKLGLIRLHPENDFRETIHELKLRG
ncbi:hypothetical protein [Pseudomonas sp. RIT-To-2]|uniref:hypothetical protein n=1 Tax=Pseudomonas sp. RIT-To-2 TaxID=3462541 RepID=UPI0040474C4F